MTTTPEQRTEIYALNNHSTTRIGVQNRCRIAGITLLGPNVNASEPDSIPDGDNIRMGLLTIRDVGPATAGAIVTGRKSGPYNSFYDFIERVGAVYPEAINRRSLLGLIRAGAFDVIGHPRQGLADVVAELVEDPTARPPIGTEEWPSRDRLELELDTLGLYLSGHPLDGMAPLLAPFTGSTVADVLAGDDGDGRVRVAGVIRSWNRRINKLGQTWATVELEDTTGVIKALMLPDVCAQSGAWLANGALIAFRGRVNRGGWRTQDGEPSDKATPPHITVDRVYDPAQEVNDFLTGYGPDNYLYSLPDQVARVASGDVLAQWVPRTPEDSSELAVSAATFKAMRIEFAGQLAAAARMIQDGGGTVDEEGHRSCDAAMRAFQTPEAWLPSAFVWSMARKLAGVLWPNYSTEQRERMRQFAAGVVERRMNRWLKEQNSPPSRARITAQEMDAVPSKVKWELYNRQFQIAGWRNDKLMLSAYLETHPANEIVQDDLDELLEQVNRQTPMERAFF